MTHTAILALFLMTSTAPILRAQETPPAEENAKPAGDETGAPKVKRAKKAKRRKKAVKKEDEYENSKYRAVMPAAASTYRFDASGNPVQPPTPKKKKAKKKKAAEDGEESSEDKSEGASPDCEGDACKSE